MAARHAIVTGAPGVGKTTLVQNICKTLREKNVPVTGFVTQEVREKGQRTGFQILTLDGQVGTLSSTRSKSTNRVGQYGVETEEFERIVLPIFSSLENGKFKGILVIDEIGKMELFSEKFKSAVIQAFQLKDLSIIATIPIQKGRLIPFVENIRHHPQGHLFIIDKTNRDLILKDVLETVQLAL